MRDLGGAWLVVVVCLASGRARGEEHGPTFEGDVRPILAKRCAVCHNARDRSDLELSGGLALDSFDSALQGGPEHKVVVAGKPGESPLFTRLGDPDDERRMPLGDTPLSISQRDVIRRWIESGAPRGKPVALAAVATAPRPARRVVRALDVAIIVPATPPRNVPLELRVKVGPLPPVTALAFGDDGKALVVGTYGQITVWNINEREVVRMLDDLPGPVLALAFSPDGKSLAAGSGLPARSGVVRVYNWPEATLRQSFEGHGDVVAGLAFRPDGERLASASYDATVRFWDLGTGKPAGVFKGHSDFVYDVAYLPDGKSVLSTSKDRTIKRIDASTATEIRSFGEHNDDVLALAVRPDGSGFVSAGNEPAVRAWTLEADKSSSRRNAHAGPVHQLAFSRDGKRLASASGDATIRVFDGALGQPRSLPGPTEWQYAVAISPDGRRVAGGGWDGIVRVWSADAATLDAVFLQPPSASPGQPAWLSLAADGTLQGSPDLRAAFRWVVGGKETRELPPPSSAPAPAALAKPK